MHQSPKSSSRLQSINWTRWYAFVIVPLAASVAIILGSISIAYSRAAQASSIQVSGLGNKLRVVAISFPIFEATRMISGTQLVDLNVLVPWNQNPENYILTQENRALVQDADIIVTLDGYAQNLNLQIAAINPSSILVLASNSSGPSNWLDISRMQSHIQTIYDALRIVDQLNQSEFSKNIEQANIELLQLQTVYEMTAQVCKSVPIILTGELRIPHITAEYIPNEFTFYQRMRVPGTYGIVPHTRVGSYASRIPRGIARLRSYHTMTQVYDYNSDTSYFTIAHQNNAMLRGLCI